MRAESYRKFLETAAAAASNFADSARAFLTEEIIFAARGAPGNKFVSLMMK
jgi:hypothetical protein